MAAVPDCVARAPSTSTAKPFAPASLRFPRATGKAITTIEGLSQSAAHPLQLAWIAEDVPQCGYCQSGQIMQAAALLAKTPHPSEQEVIDAMTGNLCRCGTYHRIRRAIARAVEAGGGRP